MDNVVLNKALADIESRAARVCIIGLGYVGLPLAIECLNSGYKVDGYDILESKVELLKRGESDVLDVPAEMVKKYVDSGDFIPTTDPSVIGNCSIALMCVPTPLGKTREPDMSYIIDSLEVIKKYMNPGTLVVLESTTYPGTTEEIIKTTLENKGFVDGEDLFVAFSPERVDPGNEKFQTHNTPKVVGADNENSLKVAADFYENVLETVVPVSSSKAAELVKLLENTFRSVNIALVNEMAHMCELLKVNVWEVINAAASKPFGFMPFFPGPGVGGHCIPIDPHYLSWKMRSYNYYPRFIELAGDINDNMSRYVIHQLVDFLNEKNVVLPKAKILLLGMAYKGDISDVRESPALILMKYLNDKNACVDFHDPFVNEIRWNDEPKRSVTLDAETLNQYDCVLMTTAHSQFDYQFIYDNSKLIYDTRNAFADIKDVDDKLRLLGT